MMVRRQFEQIDIECIEGDISDQPDIDAVVNAANAELRIGGGVAGAIHRAAGPALEEECEPFAPIAPGQAIVTRAHGLPNRFVIHCLGPVYGRDEPADEFLASCYRNALHLASQMDCRSIAFPAISTGAFGYPMKQAANVAMNAVIGTLRTNVSVAKVRFVLYDTESLQMHAQALEERVGGVPADL